MKNLKIKVYGKVQEVWFRAKTKETADEIGVKGIVKNLEDGSVYIEAEGEPSAVDTLVKWCHHGPELARVERVETIPGRIQNFTSFEIVRD